MIDKAKGKYYGVCDICSEITDDFDNWQDCKDWIKGNWKYHLNKETNEWETLCEHCKNLK